MFPIVRGARLLKRYSSRQTEAFPSGFARFCSVLVRFSRLGGLGVFGVLPEFGDGVARVLLDIALVSSGYAEGLLSFAGAHGFCLGFQGFACFCEGCTHFCWGVARFWMRWC